MKKKFITALIALALAILTALGLTACGGSSNWSEDDVTLKEWGEVISNNGFIAETENYYYFINGVGVSTDDNDFGSPVKGALMATTKDFSESCVVVPKLFVASDYKSGFYIFGDYVYYGTPCTDKDSSGNIANSKMTFARTKLDGTDTTEYFTVNSLATEYRIFGTEDTVYINYYDSENKKLVCYDTASKVATDIIATATDAESETLDTYKFMDIGPVVYTTKVYIEDYNEELAEEEGYTRATASYNKVYIFGCATGDEGVYVRDLIADGNKDIPVTYSLTYTKGGNVFVKESDATTMGDAKTYSISIGMHEDYENNKVLINDETLLADTALIDSLGRVYASDGTYIKLTSLVGDVKLSEQNVAKVSTVNKLLFEEGDYVYYINSTNQLARIKVNNVNEDAENELDVSEQLVSEDVISTSWYAPVVIDGKVFYSDSSTKGCTYVTYVDINSEVQVDTDDDGKVTKRYLDGHKYIGKKTDADIATFVSEMINSISTALENGRFVVDGEEDGVPYMNEVKEAKEAYDALTEDQKELVAEDTVKLLDKYEEAERIMAYVYKLKGFNDLSTAEKDALEDEFNDAKAELDALVESEDFTYTEIRNLFVENLNWDYQCAKNYFAE